MNHRRRIEQCVAGAGLRHCREVILDAVRAGLSDTDIDTALAAGGVTVEPLRAQAIAQGRAELAALQESALRAQAVLL
jgi:hypothetical protein